MPASSLVAHQDQIHISNLSRSGGSQMLRQVAQGCGLFLNKVTEVLRHPCSQGEKKNLKLDLAPPPDV